MQRLIFQFNSFPHLTVLLQETQMLKKDNEEGKLCNFGKSGQSKRYLAMNQSTKSNSH